MRRDEALNISPLITLRDPVIVRLLAGVRRPRLGRKPVHPDPRGQLRRGAAHERASRTAMAILVTQGATPFEVVLGDAIPSGYRLACGMLHDAAAAEDAVQEGSIESLAKTGPSA